MKLVSGIILFLFLLLCMSTLAIQRVESDPATIIVPDDYLSIQEAINAASNGDTVFVRNGTYDENIVVNKSLNLIGEDRNTTIIDGGRRDQTVVHVKAENVVIQGLTVQKSSTIYRGIFLDNARNSSIVNNNIIGNGIGILVIESPYTNVSANTLDGNVNYGIAVGGSPNVHISRNNIPYTTQFGIAVYYCNPSYVYDNRVTNCRWGLSIQGSGVHVFSNNFIDHWDCAIYFRYASRNTICQNNITGCGAIFEGLLRFGNSSDNLIFHNNFINNTGEISDWSWIFENYVLSINTWDLGYPLGGNFWSDYNGSDLYRGPFQNVTGSDGIGDDPYSVYENNTDNYPLTGIYTNTHDIGVGCVRLDRSILCQGLTAEISLDVVNYGRFTENINLTVYADTTIIKQIELTLTSINVATLTFTWDTTGFTKGNHTITATVTPVPGETCTLDNNNTCWAIISMIGDITGPDGWPDGKVDMRDLGVVASAFGSSPGHPRWNQIADINQDNKVDMRDIGTTAKHFGETDP
jgi:parallel beta-helix repeat protein